MKCPPIWQHWRLAAKMASVLCRGCRLLSYSSRSLSVIGHRVTAVTNHRTITISADGHDPSSDVRDDRSPMTIYLNKTTDGELQPNDRQAEVVSHLQGVFDQLKHYKPVTEQGFMQKLFGAKKIRQALKGVYLHGAVGGGKTMLMDLFYNCAVVDKKQRVHFNEFMLDVHQRIHTIKMECGSTRVEGRSKPNFHDPIPPVAKSILEESWLLCFDEFQVTDIGDAMILKRLFTELFEGGVVVVITSNRPPDELYKNGLQRSNFVPFIKILKDYCDVVSLESGVDYRQTGKPRAQKVYFVKQRSNADQELDKIFKLLISKENDTVRGRRLFVKGRNIFLKRTCGFVLDTTFEELCCQARGASDYLLLGQVFHTVILRDIPVLNLRMKTQARRLITLVDTFYDNKVRLVCSAEALPKDLFRIDEDFSEADITDEHRALMDDLNISKESENATATIFTGKEEIFAFDRTVSRLAEMQTEEYWQHRETT